MSAGVLAPVAQRPPRASQAWQATVNRLANAVEGVSTVRPATSVELTLINARVAVLEAALVPGPRQRIQLQVSLVLSQWHPGRAISSDRARLIVENYTLVLEPLPAWSVEIAGLMLLRGQVPEVNPDFAPSAARFYRTAREQITPYRAELDRLHIITRATACHRNGRSGHA